MMIRVSNSLIGFLNVLSLLISLPTIGVGIVLGLKSATECERYLHSPFIVLGVFLLVMSVFGVLGACCRSNLLLWIYLFVLMILIVGLLAFTIFTVVVTSRGFSGKEHRVGDYSDWLQKVVGREKDWAKVRTCLKDSMVCNGGGVRVSYFHKNLSPILSGCCKPPDSCGFTHENGTYWRKPKSSCQLRPSDGGQWRVGDCDRWSNDQNKLCYCCNSCKAGVLENVRSEWKKLTILNVLLLVFLVFVYVVGCCALRNNRTGRYQRYNGYHYR